jgi:hypothetical protein
VSSVRAHNYSDDADRGQSALTPGAPILLADIDRALEDSARVEHAGRGEPIREWRDRLAVALDSLAYARTVLSADVGILRHRLASGPDADTELADDLSHAMSSRPWGKGWSAPCGTEGHSQADWEIFARSDRLMSTHEEMAHVDLSARDDVVRVIHRMEKQLADLGRRQEAVQSRLHEIRAAIVRQYEAGAVTTEDVLG